MDRDKAIRIAYQGVYEPSADADAAFASVGALLATLVVAADAADAIYTLGERAGEEGREVARKRAPVAKELIEPIWTLDDLVRDARSAHEIELRDVTRAARALCRALLGDNESDLPINAALARIGEQEPETVEENA